MTPWPTVVSACRSYMPSFMMPLNGREQPNGLLILMITSLYNNPSSFSNQTTTTFLPLQWSDSAINNLLRNFMLKKIGKFDINLRTHNMVLSNYEGNFS